MFFFFWVRPPPFKHPISYDYFINMLTTMESEANCDNHGMPWDLWDFCSPRGVLGYNPEQGPMVLDPPVGKFMAGKECGLLRYYRVFQDQPSNWCRTIGRTFPGPILGLSRKQSSNWKIIYPEKLRRVAKSGIQSQEDTRLLIRIFSVAWLSYVKVPLE